MNSNLKLTLKMEDGEGIVGMETDHGILRIKICNPRDDSDTYEDGKVGEIENAPEDYINGKIPEPGVSEKAENTSSSNKENPQHASVGSYKRTLSGGLQPRNQYCIESIPKKASKSYQLGHQLSHKWWAGPRIGCVANYPIELRLQALEMLNLSPKVPLSPSSYRLVGGPVSPTTCPTPKGTRLDTNENSVH
ncbi:hypothetical protein VNO78_25905 [Psophocarpus tetragonolobus]|uniref:Uncharacterized protein n=1 Tax=Psophocarpus tetragonolobus TaxID=3891 RepID=A0AAN9S8L8_PSOTE